MEDRDAIVAYVSENIGSIVADIQEDVDRSESAEEYFKFCPYPDNTFEIEDVIIALDGEHYAEVLANGTFEEGHIANTSNAGPWPDVSRGKIPFRFYVDKADNGEYAYAFRLDKNGKIDFDVMFTHSDPDEFE